MGDGVLGCGTGYSWGTYIFHCEFICGGFNLERENTCALKLIDDNIDQVLVMS